MDLFTTLSTGMEVCDMAWEVKCREEDMKQRSYENEMKNVMNARRKVKMIVREWIKLYSDYIDDIS